MECKCHIHYSCFRLCGELIDTLWNVNFRNWLNSKTSAVELIDTLWNVNWYGVQPEEDDIVN